jgi:hypothetical protein
MNRQFWIITICMLLGCSNAGSDSAILSKDQMGKVLWDMIQVDELATFRLVKDSSKDVKKERIQLYEKVFQLHKTSEKQFSKSFTYYLNHPDILKVLFDSLEARGVNERKKTYISKDSTVR